MSRNKQRTTMPLANRLRAFVAKRVVDRRMNVELCRYVTELAIGAEAVDISGPDLHVAKKMLAIGVEWLEDAYVSQQPQIMQVAVLLAGIAGAVHILPGLREANRLGCEIELDEEDHNLWMCVRASADSGPPNWEFLRPQQEEDFIAAVRRVAKKLKESDRAASEEAGLLKECGFSTTQQGPGRSQ
jgi:hypothetical protein